MASFAAQQEPNSGSLYRRRLYRRQSRRGSSSVVDLADMIVNGQPVLVITGAGLSVSSGVRPFRGKEGLWSDVIWTKATREAFRKDPLKWYNEFWLPHFSLDEIHVPSVGHHALDEICRMAPNVKVITQNVDGLQTPSENLIEAHGRLGLYKCIPEEDSDTDSDSDDDDDRPVHLGHRRKSRGLQKAFSSANHDSSDSSGNSSSSPCPYQWTESIPLQVLEPPSVRQLLEGSDSSIRKPISLVRKGKKRKLPFVTLDEPPHCPSCGKPCPPQALLFDEGYHSHDFYQFEKMEEWISTCRAMVFVGTSFAVRITDVALEHAREARIPVFNFNTKDALESTARLNVENILGPSDDTLQKLLENCREVAAAQASDEDVNV